MAAWATIDDARTLWADAPLDDALLNAYLDAAQETCEEYAPTLSDGVPVPERYTVAVVLQAQEVWGSTQRESLDVIGLGEAGYAIRVRPLSTTVRALLRAHRAVPEVG